MRPPAKVSHCHYQPNEGYASRLSDYMDIHAYVSEHYDFKHFQLYQVHVQCPKLKTLVDDFELNCSVVSGISRSLSFTILISTMQMA